MRSYCMEDYARGVLEAASSALDPFPALPGALQSLRLAGTQGQIRISAVVLESEGRGHVEVEIADPDTSIPNHVDDAPKDSLLNGFLERHRLGPYAMLSAEDKLRIRYGKGEAPEAPVGWDDLYGLPRAVLVHELLLAAQVLLDRVRKKGVSVAEGCEAGTAEHDNFESDPETLGYWIGVGLSKLTPAQRREVAQLCFGSDEKRAWLLALAPSPAGAR